MATTEHDLLKKVMQKKARPGLAGGGMAKRQGQGLIRGPGTGTSDSVPIDLPSGAKIAASDSEFIIPADTTAKVGAHNLQALVDATHTPVAPKKRFGYAGGGEVFTENNSRFNTHSADFGRGPVNRTGAFFGSGEVQQANVHPGDISAANQSPQIAQGGLASRPYGAFTAVNSAADLVGQSPRGGGDTSLALSRTAVPGITPVSQYGGMDATAGKRIIDAGPSVAVPQPAAPASLAQPLPQTISATPAPTIRGLPVSSLALQQLAAPVQHVTGNNTGFSSFGYANGGRVKMADGGRLPGYQVENLGDFSPEDWDLAKRSGKTMQQLRAAQTQAPTAGAEPYPSAKGYTVAEPTVENIEVRAPRQMTPAETRLYNNPSLGDPLIQKRIAQANTNFNVSNAADTVKNAATEAVEAAKTKGGAALDWVKGKLGGGEAGGSRLLRALPLVGAGLEAANVMERSAQPHASQNEEIGKGVGRFGAGIIAANAAGGVIPQMPGALSVVRPLGMLAAGAAGYLGADKYFGRPEVPNTGSPQTPMDPKSDIPTVSNELRNFKSIEKVTPKFGELSTSNLAPSTQDEGLPSFAGNDDLRRAVVQANRPDTDYHNLGDYGAPGTRIFGRASEPGGKMNDFAGVGGGQPVPDNGVTLGIKPGDVEAYRTGAMGSGAGAQFGGLRAPEYYSSPEAQRLNTTASQMAERLAAMRPGEPGRKRLTAQLAAVNETASRLQSADQTVNAHNMSSFGHAASMQQHMLSMNNNLTVAQGQLGMKKAEIGANWQIEHAKLTNQMNEFAHQHGKDAVSRNEKVIENYVNSLFPEDKEKQAQYGGMLKVMAAAKSFDRGNKKLSLHELDAHDLSKTLGSITQQASIALQQGANKHPMNIESGQATRPATFAESLWQGARNGTPFGSVYKHLRYGQVATDDGDTVVPNFELGSAPYYRQQ